MNGFTKYRNHRKCRIFPFYRQRNGGTERLSDVPSVKEKAVYNGRVVFILFMVLNKIGTRRWCKAMFGMKAISMYRKVFEWLLKVSSWMPEGRDMHVGGNRDEYNSQDTFWRAI